MVSLITAYAIINKSVLDVADSLVILDRLDCADKPNQVRLEEVPCSVAERQQRLNGLAVVAHELIQYRNKFYSITLDAAEDVWLDFLWDARQQQQIDLTEFGEYL